MTYCGIRTFGAKHKFETCDVMIIPCNDNVSKIVPGDFAKTMIQSANSSVGGELY